MFTHPDRIGQLAQENHTGKGRNGPDVFDVERPDPVVHLAQAVAALLLDAIDRDESAALIREVAELLGEESEPAPPPAQPALPTEPLTRSETRVLRYLATYMSAPEIATELSVSAVTVKTHLRNLYRKLGAHSRHEAVHRARGAGLLAASSRELGPAGR